MRRSKSGRIGDPTDAKEDMAEDGEVFDDTDFYQQLLRDVIDARGNGAGGTDEWMTIQRQRRAKKTVDTKASKGRKIRQVHLSVFHVLFIDSIPDMKRTKNYKTSWYLCLSPAFGTRNKLMSCFHLFSGKDSAIL